MKIQAALKICVPENVACQVTFPCFSCGKIVSSKENAGQGL